MPRVPKLQGYAQGKVHLCELGYGYNCSTEYGWKEGELGAESPPEDGHIVDLTGVTLDRNYRWCARDNRNAREEAERTQTDRGNKLQEKRECGIPTPQLPCPCEVYQTRRPFQNVKHSIYVKEVKDIIVIVLVIHRGNHRKPYNVSKIQTLDVDVRQKVETV